MKTTKDGWATVRPFSEDPEDFLNVMSGEYDKKNVGVENWVECMAIVGAIRYIILKHLPEGADVETYECDFYCPEHSAEPTPGDLVSVESTRLSYVLEEVCTLGNKFKISTLRSLHNGCIYIDVHWGESPGGQSVVPLYFRLEK